MDLNEFINNKGISKYNLSKISDIPYSTLMDISHGKTKLEKCSAETIYKLAKALDCTMEEIMQFASVPAYDDETGLPVDKEYLECGLPEYLKDSLKAMIASWKIEDNGGKDMHWDIAWCDLSADINSAEVEQEISSEQAWYLREKYLRIKRGE